MGTWIRVCAQHAGDRQGREGDDAGCNHWQGCGPIKARSNIFPVRLGSGRASALRNRRYRSAQSDFLLSMFYRKLALLRKQALQASPPAATPAVISTTSACLRTSIFGCRLGDRTKTTARLTAVRCCIVSRAQGTPKGKKLEQCTLREQLTGIFSSHTYAIEGDKKTLITAA